MELGKELFGSHSRWVIRAAAALYLKGMGKVPEVFAKSDSIADLLTKLSAFPKDWARQICLMEITNDA